MVARLALEPAKEAIQLLGKPSSSNFSPQTSDEVMSRTINDKRVTAAARCIQPLLTTLMLKRNVSRLRPDRRARAVCLRAQRVCQTLENLRDFGLSSGNDNLSLLA